MARLRLSSTALLELRIAVTDGECFPDRWAGKQLAAAGMADWVPVEVGQPYRMTPTSAGIRFIYGYAGADRPPREDMINDDEREVA